MSYTKICGVYTITNIKNNIFYIGSSININKRWYQHRYLLDNNKHHCKHLQNAWNKYGSSNFLFSIEKIIDVYDIETLLLEEQKLIDLCFNQNRKIYNTNKKVKYLNEEIIKKLSLSNKNKFVSTHTRNLISQKLKGKKQSQETIKKRVQKQIGVPRSEETKQKIRNKLKQQVVSEEMKVRISNTLKGRKLTPEQKLKHKQAMSKFIGQNNKSSKLTQQQAQEIRKIRKTTKMTIAQIASLYSVSVGTIKNIISNKTYKENNE